MLKLNSASKQQKSSPIVVNFQFKTDTLYLDDGQLVDNNILSLMIPAALVPCPLLTLGRGALSLWANEQQVDPEFLFILAVTE